MASPLQYRPFGLPDNHIRPSASLNFIVIGAGSRGNAYANALYKSTHEARIVAIAEPAPLKYRAFGETYIWGKSRNLKTQCFEGWKELVAFCIAYEKWRLTYDKPTPQVDGVFICTMDDTHVEIIKSLAPLGYHIMSEKPLATTLADCLDIHRSLQPFGTESPKQLFSVGHVLRYSPHNMLLRKLLWENEIIGDIISVEHTEPVGWWHFSHSYVRGNWRKESTTAPSLLTKSCHDIDLLLWLICTPPKGALTQQLHHPREVSSTGSLLYFKKQRKPELAGAATNCYSCAAEKNCIYSAKKIYIYDHLEQGKAGWPLTAIDPDIEDMYIQGEKQAARARLEKRLRENYLKKHSEVASQRSWYGRCVFEAHNDVCDDQIVTMSWEADPLSVVEYTPMPKRLHGRGAKNAIFHMVASTEKQCERRGRIYGARGELEYDSSKIRVYDFATQQATTYHPPEAGGGHGGGDSGLAMAFFNAVKAVREGTHDVEAAQQEYIGCTLTDVVRSHAMVFAAEEARWQKKVVNWGQWWQDNVATFLFTDSTCKDTMQFEPEPK